MSIFDFFRKNQKTPSWNKEYEELIAEARRVFTDDEILDMLESNDSDDECEDLDDQKEISNKYEDFRGITFGIEYVNSKAIKSLRWVEVIRVTDKDDHPTSFYARCLTSNAFKQFRFDRISAIFDDDGVATDPSCFFHQFDIYITEFIPPKKVYGKALKAHMRDQVRVLAALSHIDGTMKSSEVDEIVIYAVNSIEESLDRIKDYSSIKKEKFLRICERVMNADSIQHSSEFDLIIMFHDRIYN